MSFWVDGEELSDEVVDDEVEYRYYIRENDGLVTIDCMSKDEFYDVDKAEFFSDDDGTWIQFYTESEAIDWMNSNIKTELIDLAYSNTDKSRFYK